MKKPAKFQLIHVRHFIAFLMMVLILPIAGICQFQASLINNMSEAQRTYEMFSDLENYRYEFNEEGMQGVVIVNPATNATSILMTEQKFVHKTKCDDMMSVMNDPVQAYQAYLKYGTEKIAGNETIEGYNCVIKELYQGDTKVFTAWFSEKLNFPLKMIGHQGENLSMQLENIKSWKVDPSYFSIPDDYTEVDEQWEPVIPEPPPPEKWEAKDAAMPFTGTASRGTRINIPIKESVYHKLIFENKGDGPSKFIYHLLSDGKELALEVQGPSDYRTFRVKAGEKETRTFNWQAGWVLVIEVYEGSLDFDIHQE